MNPPKRNSDQNYDFLKPPMTGWPVIFKKNFRTNKLQRKLKMNLKFKLAVY